MVFLFRRLATVGFLAVLLPTQSEPVVDLAMLDLHPGLQNVLQITDGMLTGGEPQGDAAFEALSKAGVKTIVSVDGARPQIGLARKYDLRYVHIPIGYGGVPDEAGKSLARLMRDAKGPFYFHCHHGRHRGPAAAAIACVAAGKMQGAKAISILQAAGTSRDYAGLWRDVENYRPPHSNAKLPDLVENAKVDSLASAMAQIDRSHDNLQLCQKAGWKTPVDHPDIAPAQEALILREALYEAGRNLSHEYDDVFKRKLLESERFAVKLEALLKSKRHAEATTQLAKLRGTCKACHARHRNEE